MVDHDIDRDLVFLPIGSPAYDFYGGDRKGQDLFANSLVALQASTGKLVWYFQMVHHDLWDYDMPAQPTLVTLRRNGELTASGCPGYEDGIRVHFQPRHGKAAVSSGRAPGP